MTLFFTELTPDEYQYFETKQPLGSYTQSILQYQLLRQRQRDAFLVGVKEDDMIVAAALITTESTRFGQVYLLDRGPLLDFDNIALVQFFTQSVKNFAKQHGALYIIWRPNVTYAATDDKGQLLDAPNDHFLNMMSDAGYTHAPFEFGMSTTGSPTWEYVKSLSDLDTPQALQQSFTKNAQYYLKKNQQFGIKLRELSREELPEFKRLTQTTADRLHYHDKDLAFYEAIYDNYGASATFIFAELNFEQYIAEEKHKIVALDQKLEKIQTKIDKYPLQEKFKRQFSEFDDQKQHHVQRVAKATQQMAVAGTSTVVVAGALFIAQPQEMTYLYSGTYEAYMDYYAPYQIQFDMMQRAVAQGIPTYNFYGISGRFDGSDGVLGFKTAFAGHARQLVGDFILPVNGLKYRLYRLLKQLTGKA
ncbi:aminoacyltransferase [Leuconostoc holzapfelii]|uniref:Aminoacyltransferase FemA n=1 Tax=Leuconostoc holzapfelii TaxID=434464 RepID=A0A846ZGH4_9LACO|nr:aminoacyltransferase [Leuconostoc holzapfelii]NKZ18869.1 aminoacyltransferase [Leuconostoc holzapfelii]